MCRAGSKPCDNLGARFVAMVAGPAERYQIAKRIGLADRPRDDVVNVKTSALPCQFRFGLPAFLAGMPIAGARKGSMVFPVSPSAIVLRCSALPQRTIRAAFCPDARGHVTRMAAKPARLTVKAFKYRPAIFASLAGGLHATPSRLVVAGHVAEAAGFSMMRKGFKLLATPLASFCDAGPRLGWLTSAGTIPPAPAASEGRSALRASFFHSISMPESGRVIKNFDITRQQPTQEAMDL